MTAAGGRPRLEVRHLATRVALGATALVAVVYLATCVAVVVFVTSSLTAQVDARLTGTLERIAEGAPPGFDGVPNPPADRPLGYERGIWLVRADGSVLSDRDDLPLPANARQVSSPQSITIEGHALRLAGTMLGTDRVVVGESLAGVDDARGTVIIGELLIAPALLIVVFLGAIAIGRRVATPIDLARQRQVDFTADASHELRTPLSVIEANASLALSQPREASWYRRAFEQVDAESKRMRHLLEDMLWLARFDATDRAADAEPVDLGVLAAQAADRFTPVAEAKHLVLTVRTEPAGAVVTAPPVWLDRLLGVLLDNACKYSPSGGKVTVGVASAGPRVALTVDDSGPGIPEAERERVFDRFHRVSDGQAGVQGGAGLGLAIADAIVRASGGRWQVGRSPFGGARMSVSWPRASGRTPVPVPDSGYTPGRPVA